MRPKKGNELWNKQTQFVAFYLTDEEETPVMQFSSVREIVKWRGLPQNKASYDLVVVELYRALRRESHYTEMLGQPMTVYLIDND